MLYLNEIQQPRTYKYTSTKEYHDAFPCAYRNGVLIVTVI